MTIRELLATMPREEKIGALVIPPLFLAIFAAIWIMLPA